MVKVTFRRVHLWLPPLIYMAVIFHFSSEPNPLPEITGRVWDKGLHVVEYAGLALLICRALIGEGVTLTNAALIAVVAASAYAASDEWHQAFTPMRSSDVRDWMADTIGAMLGAGSFARFGGRPPES